MNLNTLAHLIRPDVTTCEVRFLSGSHKAYTFKISAVLADEIQQKILDTGLEVPVVVDTCNGCLLYTSDAADE